MSCAYVRAILATGIVVGAGVVPIARSPQIGNMLIDDIEGLVEDRMVLTLIAWVKPAGGRGVSCSCDVGSTSRG